jgi:hypothetical protein
VCFGSVAAFSGAPNSDLAFARKVDSTEKPTAPVTSLVDVAAAPFEQGAAVFNAQAHGSRSSELRKRRKNVPPLGAVDA